MAVVTWSMEGVRARTGNQLPAFSILLLAGILLKMVRISYTCPPFRCHQTPQKKVPPKSSVWKKTLQKLTMILPINKTILELLIQVC